MLNLRTFTLFIALTVTAGALIVLIDRGGLIAWGTLAAGIALLAKAWLKPSRLDLGLSAGIVAIPVLAWFGTLYYVISTWETGEVVELTVDTRQGIHTARVWVLEVGPHPLVYYDAPPEVAISLLAGRPLQFSRTGKVSTRIPDATRVEELTEDEANQIFAAMEKKYGDRVDAADVFYLMLGRSRDRIALVARLIEA